MVDETVQRSMDAEEHRKAYRGVMKFAAEVGVPFCMALAMFFTQLVLAHGLGVALLSFLCVYVFVWWVVRTFFTH